MRDELSALGTQVAFVHMQAPEEADEWFRRYGLSDVARFSDPAQAIYRAFDLGDGSLFALAHPRVWGRWLSAAVNRGAGLQGSKWRQLTGVFVVRNGDVLAEIRHANSAARPDYVGLVKRALQG